MYALKTYSLYKHYLLYFDLFKIMFNKSITVVVGVIVTYQNFDRFKLRRSHATACF